MSLSSLSSFLSSGSLDVWTWSVVASASSVEVRLSVDAHSDPAVGTRPLVREDHRVLFLLDRRAGPGSRDRLSVSEMVVTGPLAIHREAELLLLVSSVDSSVQKLFLFFMSCKVFWRLSIFNVACASYPWHLLLDPVYRKSGPVRPFEGMSIVQPHTEGAIFDKKGLDFWRWSSSREMS